MFTKVIRPVLLQAAKPSSYISTLSKTFTTSAHRLDSEQTENLKITRDENEKPKDKPGRRVFAEPTDDEPVHVSVWDPSKNLSLDETIDRHIHFLHPMQIWNSKGEAVAMKPNNIIRARGNSIVDPETGDMYVINCTIDRYSPIRELNHGWVPDRHTEMDKTPEQRKMEEEKREEQREAIVRRRLALWSSEFKVTLVPRSSTQFGVQSTQSIKRLMLMLKASRSRPGRSSRNWWKKRNSYDWHIGVRGMSCRQRRI
jgi:hypothetical protein